MSAKVPCVDTVTHEGDLVVHVGDGKTKTTPVQETNKTNKAFVKNPVWLLV